MRSWRQFTGAMMAAVWLGGVSGIQAVETPETGSVSNRLEVLNAKTALRYRMAYKTPVVVNAAGEVKTALEGKDPKPMREYESAPPPADWMTPGFDDTDWSREPAPVEVPAWSGGPALAANTGYRLCLRGKFMVEDPAAVKELKVSVDYVGGAVLFVNGKEIARGHLPPGDLKPDTCAEKYPDETYLDAEGFLTSDMKTEGERLARRVRRLTDVEISPNALRKGLNVVAVELRRSPVSESLLGAKRRPKPAACILPHLGLMKLEVTAAPGSAATTNAGGLNGQRVWTSGPYDMVYANDRGDVQEKPLAMTIVAARNGTFSGRAVLSSTNAIKRLQASVSELSCATGGGKIPASSIRVRYAEPASEGKGWVVNRQGDPRFDLLLDAPPPEGYAVRGPAGAAVAACIWVTVRVAPDVAAGEYRGELTVQAEGWAAVKVPVVVSVQDWRLPDPKDFSVRNNFFPSHETVALYYNVPFWSEKHLSLMGREMELLGELGCRMAMVNLAKYYQCMGNTESMVKWLRQADGSYKYDFSAVDKYLDVVAAKMGKPAVLRLNLWSERGGAKVVSVQDPATNNLVDLIAPPSSNIVESVAFWKPVLDGVRGRLEKRGWLDVAAFGYTSYTADPSPDIVQEMKQLWDGAHGYKTSHGNSSAWTATDKSSFRVICNEGVWASGGLYNPDRGAGGAYPMPWKGTARKMELGFPREGVCNIDLLRESYSRLSCFRLTPESCLQGSLDGIGNVGADFWPLKDAKGKLYRQANQDQLGPGACLLAILSPGADGPAVNERYEMFREGVQITEAMIFLQKALESGKLSDELARQVRGMLDDRARQYLRTRRGMWPPQSLWSQFEGSGVRERDSALLSLCAEVTRTK